MQNRLTSVGHDKGGTIASASYTLDNVGNRTGRVDQQGTHSYAYDNLYRLTSATYPGPSTKLLGTPHQPSLSRSHRALRDRLEPDDHP